MSNYQGTKQDKWECACHITQTLQGNKIPTPNPANQWQITEGCLQEMRSGDHFLKADTAWVVSSKEMGNRDPAAGKGKQTNKTSRQRGCPCGCCENSGAFAQTGKQTEERRWPNREDLRPSQTLKPIPTQASNPETNALTGVWGSAFLKFYLQHH